ncbi:MAG: hypothetical protein WCK27_11065 [Verrucomicrobiota bacterium]
MPTRAMSNLFLLLSASGACILLAACSTVTPQKQVAFRFAELKEKGKLPGFAPTDHGDMHTQGYPLGGRVTYPASMVVYATKEGDSARYAYTFTKEDPSSEWRLTAATRIALDGQREDLSIQ